MTARIPIRISATVAACLLACLSAHAQISYSGGNSSQDFNALPFDMTTAQFIPGVGPFEVPVPLGVEQTKEIATPVTDSHPTQR